MKISGLHIALMIIIFGYSCGDATLPNPEIAIQKELKRKVSNYLLTRNDDCKISAILDAEIYVDSIIYEMTRFSALEDSIEMISKPSGPDRPSYIEIKEKGAILPFPIDSIDLKN